MIKKRSQANVCTAERTTDITEMKMGVRQSDALPVTLLNIILNGAVDAKKLEKEIMENRVCRCYGGLEKRERKFGECSAKSGKGSGNQREAGEGGGEQKQNKLHDNAQGKTRWQ